MIIGMTKLIPLTQGFETIVDDNRYDELIQYNWFSMRVKNRVYAVRHILVKPRLYRQQLMHRFIMGEPEGLEVDHINRNALDNRAENLRETTSTHNNWNKGLTVRNTSGYIGVDWAKHIQKWRCRINHFNKNINLGTFDDPIEAARAYDTKAIELRGEFAVTNQGLCLLPILEP